MRNWILKYDGSSKAIARHILLWLLFYLAFTFIMAFYGGWRKFLIINPLITLLFALAYYSLRYWQIPILYKKGKTTLFVLSLIIGTLLCYSIYWGVRLLILEELTDLHQEVPFKYFGEYLVRSLRFYSPAFLLLVWEYQHKRKYNQVRIRELEKEKLATELKFLKAQINPHFLFNTLNNLYSFVLTESPQAGDMLDRLTGIFQYAFEKSKLPYVPLKMEVDTISDYLALEEIRYGDRLTVNYKIQGDMTLQISPLILLSIIENAFKHGASGDINAPRIDIDVRTLDQHIECRVWNTKSTQSGEINDAYKSGIGLSNIRRQLHLIYPDRHRLTIEDRVDSFTLTLSINTST